jgi:phage protein D
MLSSFSNEKVLSIYYDLYFSGVKLPFEKKICVTSIEVKETEDGADNATIVINDIDFQIIEDNIFIEDVPVKIEAGWHDEIYRFEFNGYIATIDIDFPSEGYPVINIYCIDNTHLMNRDKRKRTWDNVTSANVVQLICAEYGFQTIVEPGYDFKKEDNIAQSNQTDIEFIQSLAGKENDKFVCKLRGNIIYYVKKGLLTQPIADLWYKTNTRDIISLKPKINKETKQEEVREDNITSKDKKIDKGVASNTATNRQVQGEPMKTTSSPTSGSSTSDSGGSTSMKFGGEHGSWTEVKR